MAVVPLLVLSTALLVPAAGSSDVSPSVISGIVGGLADVCLESAKQIVAKEVTTRLQHVQEQVTVIQEQQTEFQQQQMQVQQQQMQVQQQQTEVQQQQMEVQQQLTGVQQQLTALQEQLSAVQQQQTALQHQLPRCPDRWSYHNNSCYLRPQFGRYTWREANQACPAFDPRARLVSIHLDNKDHVHRLLAEERIREGVVWIGLFRRDDGSSWAWADGTPVDYTNWRDGEPNNNDEEEEENCVSTYLPDRGEWNDRPCSGRFAFLCQIILK